MEKEKVSGEQQLTTHIHTQLCQRVKKTEKEENES